MRALAEHVDLNVLVVQVLSDHANSEYLCGAVAVKVRFPWCCCDASAVPLRFPEYSCFVSAIQAYHTEYVVRALTEHVILIWT